MKLPILCCFLISAVSAGLMSDVDKLSDEEIVVLLKTMNAYEDDTPENLRLVCKFNCNFNQLTCIAAMGKTLQKDEDRLLDILAKYFSRFDCHGETGLACFLQALALYPAS